MQNVEADTEANARPLLAYLAVFAIGAAGILIKRPFGLYLFHVMGKQPTSPHTFLQWIMTDYAALAIVLLACVLHRYSGLPLAPRVERLFSSEARARPKTPVLQPGLVGTGATLLVFIASQIYQTFSHTAVPIAARLHAGAIPRSEMLTLAALFPLAFIGAPLSEEVCYRFGFLSVLMGAMSFVRLGGRNPNNAIAFWIANLIQGAWFGFIHVEQGVVVAAQSGSLLFQIAVAPQTWGGVIFGLVYRRFGLEAAIVAHIGADITGALLTGLWSHFIH